MKKNKFKVGDLIYCHTACITNSDVITTTINKYYEIVGINDSGISINDDVDADHLFSFKKDEFGYNYKTWFLSLKA